VEMHAQWFHIHYRLRTHSKYCYHDTLHRKMTRRYQERRKLSPAYQSQAWSAAATVRNTTSSTTAITRSEYTCRATCCVQYLVIVATCVSRHTQVEPQVHRAQIENSNVTPAQSIRATRAKAIIQNTNSERSLKAQQQTSLHAAGSTCIF
jgi:hypothetical protein